MRCRSSAAGLARLRINREEARPLCHWRETIGAPLPQFEALASAYGRVDGPGSEKALECRAQAARCRSEIGQVAETLTGLQDVVGAPSGPRPQEDREAGRRGRPDRRHPHPHHSPHRDGEPPELPRNAPPPRPALPCDHRRSGPPDLDLRSPSGTDPRPHRRPPRQDGRAPDRRSRAQTATHDLDEYASRGSRHPTDLHVQDGAGSILHRRPVRDYEHRPASSASRAYWAMTHITGRRLSGANTPAWHAPRTAAA